MEDKFLHHLQEGAQSYPYHSKKRKKVVQKLQPIEYFNLIPPAKEEESSNNESKDNCRQILFIKIRKKIPKKTEKNQDNPLIKDLIINKQEPIEKQIIKILGNSQKKKNFRGKKLAKGKHSSQPTQVLRILV